MPERRAFWAPRAWVEGRWQDAVLLRCDARAHWESVSPGVPAPPGAQMLAGPVLPGLVDAHSHAFQRAFAGLAERREAGREGSPSQDDFWSWRDRMYGVANRIEADALRAVAAQLYVELLRGGYTQVCEFHYLQHRPGGRPYDDPATLAWALSDAAEQSGIGLTLLPALYERAGFDVGVNEQGLRPDQRRFASTPADIDALRRRIDAAARPRVNAGIAIHSLRAAPAASIAQLLQLTGDADLPIHVHVAEQTAEVDACLAATGQRPIEHLLAAHAPDARWQLVHATHATPAEIDAVARSGAGVVLCPSTEANLGDGVPDLPRWLAAAVPLALGSDSQVSRSWAEELRWLEYAQRLWLRTRNLGAAPQHGQPSTAARLFDAVRAGGGRAAGQAHRGLRCGARADLLVLDTGADGLRGVPASHALDALVFATDAPAFAEVYVGGERVVAGGRHVAQDAIAQRFGESMMQLWGRGQD